MTDQTSEYEDDAGNLRRHTADQTSADDVARLREIADGLLNKVTTDHSKPLKQAIEEFRDELVAVIQTERARIDALRDALEEYGAHHHSCPRWHEGDSDCNCGLDMARGTNKPQVRKYEASPERKSP